MRTNKSVLKKTSNKALTKNDIFDLETHKKLENKLDKAIQKYVSSCLRASAKVSTPSSLKLYSHLVDRVERVLFTEILEYNGGNKSKSAILMGINRKTLSSKLKELDKTKRNTDK